MEEYTIPIKAEKIKENELAIPKAIEALSAIHQSDFCRLLNVYSKPNKDEVIEFETEVEVGQYPPNDIRSVERLAIEFSPDDLTVPRVYALRSTFPLLPHTNLELEELPRSLCLYDRPYEEVKLFWTGFIFIERIREWLKLSAIDKLHQDDQPLEPFILEYQGNLFLPHDVSNPENLFIYKIGIQKDGKVNLIVKEVSIPQIDQFPCSLHVIKTEAQTHGVIRKAPQNLFDLDVLLASAGINFRNYLLPQLKKLYGHKPKDIAGFIIELPKRRKDAEEVSSVEWHAFLTHKNVEDICVEIGLYEKSDHGNGFVMGYSLSDDALKKIQISVFRPHFEFNPLLAQLSNSTMPEDGSLKITAVGLGALGSQVFMNCIRAGFGEWILVDDDYLFPHNLARHALIGGVGLAKTESLSTVANRLLNKEVSKAVVGNVVKEIKRSDFLQNFTQSSLILDMSASTSALKSISNETGLGGRIASLFLNSNGSDLVALIEDGDKKIKIDHLEAQYFRSLLHISDLADHMKVNGQPIRYSNSCSDISARISQDHIAQHAAIASSFIKRSVRNLNSSIEIFKINVNTSEVKRIEIPVCESQELKIGDWTLIFDKWFLDKIYSWREYKLPNETGGVLLGTYDMSKKRIYLIDSILSPGDSIEYPTAYIRGIDGLEAELRKVLDLTGKQVQYIGEWHSHPKGYSSQPSKDDMLLFTWLTDNMRSQGMPPLMMIAGTNYDYRFLIE